MEFSSIERKLELAIDGTVSNFGNLCLSVIYDLHSSNRASSIAKRPMLQHQTSVKAVIRGQTREPITLKAGITKLRQNLSHSIGICRDSIQENEATTKMSPSHERRQARRQSNRWEGGEQQGENEDTGNANGEASSKAGNSSATSQSSDSPGASALAVAIRNTASQLQESQEATKALLEACNKYTKEFDQFPALLKRFNKRSQEATFKANKIQEQKHIIRGLREEISENEQAAKDVTEANLEETKRLQAEREEFEKQKEAIMEELRKEENEADDMRKAKDAQLNQEAEEKLSRREAELEKKFQDFEKGLKCDMEKLKREHSEEVAKLEKTKKEQRDTIKHQTAQITEMLLELDSKDAKNKRLKKEKDREVSENEALEAKLKDQQKEFALDSKPLEFYKDKFLQISMAIQSITSRYLARDLNTQEIIKLRKKLIAADLASYGIPFSNIEPSMQLIIFHAQRVISHAIQTTVWQDFSSDKTVAHPGLPKFLQEIEAEVSRSGIKSHGSNRTARLWKALTVSAINPGSTDMESQEDMAQKLTSSQPRHCRADKVIKDVVRVLKPLLDASTLPQFNLELFHLVNNAISVWTCAQVDEQMFTIYPILNEQNKQDWADVTLDPNSSNADVDRQHEVGSKQSNSENVFALFPVVIATTNIHLPNEPRSVPGSFPEQDQQPPNIEVTIIHKGLGLPEASEIVQRGKELNERRKMEKNKLAESLTEELVETIKVHSRQSSMAQTVSVPSSPSADWAKNGKNGFVSEF